MNAEVLKEFRDGYLHAAGRFTDLGRTEDAEIAEALAELADWHLCRVLARLRALRRPGLVGGRGPRECKPVPMPPPAQRLNVTIPGMPSPAIALAQREEEPFPLCRVARLPGVPRTPTPANGTLRPGPHTAPQDDPDSLFTRALAWTLKSRRA